MIFGSNYEAKIIDFEENIFRRLVRFNNKNMIKAYSKKLLVLCK
jgi:hypothetical protein